MLYFCGDTHGFLDTAKLNMKSFPDGKALTKNDYVIICGDFGGVWDGGEEDKFIQNWFNKKPWTTLFIDGNHENFDLLETYPITEWNGGKVQKISDSIIHLMRGQVYTIDGVTIFTMGGATSVDRGPHVFKYNEHIHKIWWPQEDISFSDMEEAHKNLEKVDFKVDIVVTHDVPTETRLRMGYHSNDANAQLLQQLKDQLTYKVWFAGHWHRYEQYGNIQILYNQVVKYKKDGSWTKITQNIYNRE